MGYDDDAPKIPAAAVTVEDAQLLDRWSQRGPVSVHLRLDDQMLPDVESANVIGELRGKDKPDELVVIGGHLDSWDVGQGAHDDGAGIVTMLQALPRCSTSSASSRAARSASCSVHQRGERRARRQGVRRRTHADELAKTVLAVESDSGGFAPRGFRADRPRQGRREARRRADRRDRVAAAAAPRDPRARRRAAAPTSSRWSPRACRRSASSVDMHTYFDYHHTEADTLDKVDPQKLADDVAAIAVLAYVVADLPGPPRRAVMVVARRSRACSVGRSRSSIASSARRRARSARRDRGARRDARAGRLADADPRRARRRRGRRCSTRAPRRRS